MEFAELLLDEIDSTNSEAKRLIETGQIDKPYMILANRQTAGRGSRGRDWDSRPGNLMVTYVFDLPADLRSAPLLVYPIALAVRDLLQDCDPHLDLALKWPNDVLLSEKKISGALHEVAQKGQKRFFVAGIGINLAWHPPTTNSLYPPTCLADHLSQVPSPLAAARNLADHLVSRISNWSTQKFENHAREEFLSCAFRLGKQIKVATRGSRAGDVHGTFETINEWGALVLKTGDLRKEFVAADIFPSLDV